MRTRIGYSEKVFAAAIRRFRSWQQFELGWVRVANPTARVDIGEIVAVEVFSLGLWSLNLSQIVDVVQNYCNFGFVYKTTSNHVEWGEERFLLTFESDTQAVWYETEAVSRPRYWMARIARPVTRMFQHGLLGILSGRCMRSSIKTFLCRFEVAENGAINNVQRNDNCNGRGLVS